MLVVADNERDAFFDDGPTTLPLPAAERVDVGGRSAAYRQDTRTYTMQAATESSRAVTMKYLGVHVTWKVSNGLWASVNVEVSRTRLDSQEVGKAPFDPNQLRADVLRIAGSARLAPRTPEPVIMHRYPFTVGYLPADVRKNGRILEDGWEHFTKSDDWNSGLAMAQDGARRSGWDGSDHPDGATAGYYRDQLRNKLLIQVRSSSAQPLPGPNDFQVNGKRAEWAESGAGLFVEAGPNGGPAIEVWGDLPKAELLKIAQGIRLVDDPNRHESWTAEPLG